MQHQNDKGTLSLSLGIELEPRRRDFAERSDRPYGALDESFLNPRPGLRPFIGNWNEAIPTEMIDLEPAFVDQSGQRIRRVAPPIGERQEIVLREHRPRRRSYWTRTLNHPPTNP